MSCIDVDDPITIYIAPPYDDAVLLTISVEFSVKLASSERMVNSAPPQSDAHFVMFVESKRSVDDDALRYNAPPFEFAVQFVISVELSVKLVSAERRMKRAPPFSEMHSDRFVEFKITIEDDEPLRYKAPPLD